MKFNAETVERWCKLCADHLALRGETLADVQTGVKAWATAHDTGITREAYSVRSVIDAHIQTALERIFPNAVFKDRKVY